MAQLDTNLERTTKLAKQTKNRLYYALKVITLKDSDNI